jgi:hypothetical protein
MSDSMEQSVTWEVYGCPTGQEIPLFYGIWKMITVSQSPTTPSYEPVESSPRKIHFKGKFMSGYMYQNLYDIHVYWQIMSH